ncbi:MAG: hypothetical protein ABSF81_07765 [Bacteroidales bacterium]|jgi:hypothetical protein
MKRKASLFEVKVKEALDLNCSCVECIKMQGLFKYLLEDRAAMQKRIAELIVKGPAEADCKIVAWHN